MTPEQFIYWLQGYTAALEAPEDWRMATIRERLAEVELGRVYKPSDRGAEPVAYPPAGSPTLRGPDVPYAHDLKRCSVGGIVKAMDPIATVDRCDTSKFFLRGADAEDDDFEGAPV